MRYLILPALLLLFAASAPAQTDTTRKRANVPRKDSRPPSPIIGKDTASMPRPQPKWPHDTMRTNSTKK